ncbi:hypothetical protein ACU686_09225 [Yinghuangia aomiensis]
MRRAIADPQEPGRSQREIPHYCLSSTIDVTAVVERTHTLSRELPVEERLVRAAFPPQSDRRGRTAGAGTSTGSGRTTGS